MHSSSLQQSILSDHFEEKEEWLHRVRMLQPAVYKAWIWEVGVGVGVVKEFWNNQSFIQWITEKYVNKNTEKMHTYYTISFRDILPICLALGS